MNCRTVDAIERVMDVLINQRAALQQQICSSHGLDTYEGCDLLELITYIDNVCTGLWHEVTRLKSLGSTSPRRLSR